MSHHPWGPEDTGLFIVSFPKCGRTWLRVMLLKAMSDTFQLEEAVSKTFQIDGLTRYLKKKHPELHTTHFTHTHSSLLAHKPYHWILSLKASAYEVFKTQHVILLVRDPRDAIVSYYFHITKRKGSHLYQPASLQEFIQNDTFGIRKLLAFYQSWYQFQHIPKSFTVIKYEDLHLQPVQTLSKVLEIMRFPTPTPEVLERAIEWGRFENMQKLEQSDYFKHESLRPKNPQDPDSFKVREGKIGGYKAHLTPEDLDVINKAIEEIGLPFYTLQS